MFLRILLFILAFLLLLVNTAIAVENDPILGKAGDYVIKKSDLDRLISFYSPDKQKYLRENPQQKVLLIKRMIEVKIIADIAKREGFDRKPDVKEQLEFIVNDYLTSQYLSKVIMKNIEVTDEDIKQYYVINKNKFSVPEQVKASHILVSVPFNAPDDERKKAKEKAEQILEKLKKGEDFAKLIREYSNDPRSDIKGENIGYFSKGKMVKPFEEAAFSLKPGQISDIVETSFGYHIIRVEDHTEARIKTLDEVKDLIKEQIKTDLARSKATEFIEKTAKDAGMEIYQDKIVEVQSK